MRDDDAPGPLTPASVPPGVPAKSKISRGGMAPARLGREDPRNFGRGTLDLGAEMRLGADERVDVAEALVAALQQLARRQLEERLELALQGRVQRGRGRVVVGTRA